MACVSLGLIAADAGAAADDVVTLAPVVVSAAGDASLGAGALAGALAAGGALDLGMGGAFGAGQDFFGVNGASNGFTNLASFQDAIEQGAATPTGADAASAQAIYNQSLQSMIDSGMSQADAESTLAASGMTPSGYVGTLQGALSEAPTTLAPVTVTAAPVASVTPALAAVPAGATAAAVGLDAVPSAPGSYAGPGSTAAPATATGLDNAPPAPGGPGSLPATVSAAAASGAGAAAVPAASGSTGVLGTSLTAPQLASLTSAGLGLAGTVAGGIIQNNATNKANAANQANITQANNEAWTSYLLQRGISTGGIVPYGTIPTSGTTAVNTKLPLWATINTPNSMAGPGGSSTLASALTPSSRPAAATVPAAGGYQPRQISPVPSGAPTMQSALSGG